MYRKCVINPKKDKANTLKMMNFYYVFKKIIKHKLYIKIKQ